MQALVVGAGPSGTVAALLMARAGHQVVLVDRDPGPRDDDWDRVGVMQFWLPQALRAPGRLLLEHRLPDVHQALVEAGAVVKPPVGAPPSAAGLHVRRPVMERVLWRCADGEPGVTRRVGHVDDLVVNSGRVTGVVVDGVLVAADLVVDASGRTGRLGGHRDHPVLESASPFAYAAREYRLLTGAAPGPLNGGPGLAVAHDGFMEMVFEQDAGTFQTLIVRRSEDRELAMLRDESAHSAASRLLPGLAAWTGPERAEPIGPVRVGAGLVNRYQPQATGVVGLLAVGDAALVTNPVAARGLSLGFASAAAMTDVITSRPEGEWAAALEDWARASLLPWYADHCALDHSVLARWRHRPLVADDPLGWDVVGDAAALHPEWRPVLGPFLAMLAPPSTLDPLREEVRSMIRAGWQPPRPGGVTRDELAAVIAEATVVPAA